MTRINVYARDNEAIQLEYSGRSLLLGWFNLESCTDTIVEGQAWDGNNMRGAISGIDARFGGAELLRTRKGQWVNHHDARRELRGPEYYEFLTNDQAREWLMRADTREAEEALERYFTIMEEAGPNLGGRPEVGPIVKVRMPDALIAGIDSVRGGTSRAQWIREAVEQRLGALTQDAS